jgi:anaerobic selenocysteine-containing dehydrogenase
VTGAPLEVQEYRALNPLGRAVIKAADYHPPHELPDEAYPLQLITGRTVYHFHTRTRTARAPELQRAAPEVWVELSTHDAELLGLGEGDLAEIRTRRGEVQAKVRISGIRPGVAFLPFHYGYWDTAQGWRPDDHGRAANELTLTDWDPASKQPIFKTAACAVRKVADGDGRLAPAPVTTASAPVGHAASEEAS